MAIGTCNALEATCAASTGGFFVAVGAAPSMVDLQGLLLYNIEQRGMSDGFPQNTLSVYFNTKEIPHSQY